MLRVHTSKELDAAVLENEYASHFIVALIEKELEGWKFTDNLGSMLEYVFIDSDPLTCSICQFCLSPGVPSLEKSYIQARNKSSMNLEDHMKL